MKPQYLEVRGEQCWMLWHGFHWVLPFSVL
jgi:hypothetical protein